MEQTRPTPGSSPTPEWWRYGVWMAIVLAVSLFWSARYGGPSVETLSYTDFKQKVTQNQVASVTFVQREIDGVYRKRDAEQAGQRQTQPEQPPGHFTTVMPVIDDPELLKLLQQHDVTIQAKSGRTSPWVQALLGLLPWVLIFGLFWYAMTRLQKRMAGLGPAGGMFGFGKSKARRFRHGSMQVTFADVAGLENAKRDLREIIGYLSDPARYTALGAKVPKGILLMGPPGTGKTLLAKASAGEAGVPFYSISGSEFIEMFVGVGAARVRDMFESAKQEAPAIIFIDEIDSVGRARGTGLGGGHDEREQTLNQILNEMDGFDPHEAVVVMAATNRPDVLDPALLRPGRFDRKLTLDLPRKEARQMILEVHTRHVPLADDVDLARVALRTVGFSGADLENLVNEAALLAGREHLDQVTMALFDAARDKIILGAEREGLLSEEEKRVVACHEAGHALLAHLLPEADPLDKVTIIPRGRALGATEQTPAEDRQNLRRSYLLDRLTVMLGGRAAETVVFGDITSGAEADLKQATQLARRMVAQWGMSQKLGPVAFRRDEEHVFLGREMAQQRDFSEATAERIDQEIEALVRGSEQRAVELIGEHRAKLQALADRLLEVETVEAAEIAQLFAD